MRGPSYAGSVTYLVATVGRPSLEATLRSIFSQRMPGDEVLVIGATTPISEAADRFGFRFIYCEPGNDWGASERAYATQYATGQYLAYIDDDDVCAPGARAAIAAAIADDPGKPFIFRMQYGHDGPCLWDAPVLRLANVGTPMFVLPNDPERLPVWPKGSAYGNDFEFIHAMKWPHESIVWRPEVIAKIRPS